MVSSPLVGKLAMIDGSGRGGLFRAPDHVIYCLSSPFPRSILNDMALPIRAHFDGKRSLVLDEAVDLPVGKPLRVHIETVEETGSPMDLNFLQPLLFPADPEVAKQWIDDPEATLDNS